MATVDAAAAPDAPDAGRLLEDIQSSPTLPEKIAPVIQAPRVVPLVNEATDLQIQIADFNITGASEFPASQLRDLVKQGIGKNISLTEISELAQEITKFYRRKGYFLARAYVPGQDIKDGIVEIAVIEGRLDTARVENHSLVSDSVLLRYMDATHRGDALTQQKLERALLLMNDLPGVSVRAALRPGADVGTSIVDIRAENAGRFNATLDADNGGNRFTGEFRFGATGYMNSPLGWGDQLSLRAMTSGPGLSYGRASWQTPIGGDGLKTGIAWSELKYKLLKDFSALDANGRASVGTAWASYPLIVARDTRLVTVLTYNHKSIEDRIDSSSSKINKVVNEWSFGINGNHRDDIRYGGYFSFDFSITTGHLHLDSGALAVDQSPAGHSTAGQFTKANLSFTRSDRLWPSLILTESLSGQLASRNLDSSEKFSLGGIDGVRAYPGGEAAGDRAWLGSIEMRWIPYFLPEVQPFMFFEGGGASINRDALSTDHNNSRSVIGEGVGLTWTRHNNFHITGTAAFRSGDEPTADVKRTPRLYVSAVKYF